MKLQGILVLMVMLVSFSCKNKSGDKEQSDVTESIVLGNEADTNGEVTTEMTNCDDFINKFEEWSERYIAFMAKYKGNPMKAVTSPEYSEMMGKASSWSQEWLSISASCGQNSSYEERVEEISNRMEKKIEELGFK
ncbi:MAG: hypothetical protein ACFB0A_05650 [Croceivirga sp.]